MRIVMLNLRHGGSRRAPALADHLVQTEAAVLVCPEFRLGPSGDVLSDRLGAAGYVHRFVPDVPPRTNTVAVFSRSPAEPFPLSLPAAEAHRAIAALVNGITVVGVYLAQLKAKRPLFDWLLSNPPELACPAVVIGDFNTGLHRADEAGATFCCHAFAPLPEAGWVDAWRHLNGDAQEFTWFSNAGNGFRIDHAFVTADLAERVKSEVCDHPTRESLTDHSALSLQFRCAKGAFGTGIVGQRSTDAHASFLNRHP